MGYGTSNFGAYGRSMSSVTYGFNIRTERSKDGILWRSDTTTVQKWEGKVGYFSFLLFKSWTCRSLQRREFKVLWRPFRSLVYAMFVPWYSNAVRDYHAGEKLNAGFNDLFMSVYLRYCDQFVTADAGQEKALREVALAAGLETKILSYGDSCKSLLVTI